MIGVASYSQQQANRQVPAVRPARYEDLLLHPIADNPLSPNAASYDNWEFDHGAKPRFHVAGLFWFSRLTGMTMQDLKEGYSEAAREEVQNTPWISMPNSQEAWTQAIARQQFQRARGAKATRFQKAGVIILACELALEDMLNNGANLPIKSAQEVYQNMAIVPAVWNIDDFNERYLKSLSDNQILDLAAASQQPKAVISALATGFTATYSTVELIKAKADTYSNKPGRVRARPGGKSLGKRGASEFETVPIG